jgi:hypothetical protein
MIKSLGLSFALVATWPLSAAAQFGTFRDDFGNDVMPHAQQHNYQPGAVPAGGIWTGVHNSMNGGGPFGSPPVFVPADFVADGFNFAGVDKAGKLLIEDLVLHPNTNPSILGVAWEGGINNAPFLYREVPADAKITATMKIDSQNSGQWHYASVIARLKAPTGAPDTPVGFGRGDTLDPTESFVTIGSFRTAADNTVASILTQSVVNAVEMEVNTGGANGLPLWVRMVKNGGLFEAYSSINGVDFTLRNSIMNAELNTPGEILQVGPSNMSFTSESGATQSTVEIDFFEITVLPGRLPGDYNGDRAVNAGDYPVWRNSLGDDVLPGTGADGTGPSGVPDGSIDLLDYAFWKEHYGDTAPGATAGTAGGMGESLAAVPELATIVLFIGGTVAILLRARRDRAVRGRIA